MMHNNRHVVCNTLLTGHVEPTFQPLTLSQAFSLRDGQSYSSLSSLTVMVGLASTAAASASESSPLGRPSLGSFFRLKSSFVKQENHLLHILSHTTPSPYVLLLDFAAAFALFLL